MPPAGRREIDGGIMRNTLGDLNNYLFETLERLLDEDITDDEAVLCYRYIHKVGY